MQSLNAAAATSYKHYTNKVLHKKARNSNNNNDNKSTEEHMHMYWSYHYQNDSFLALYTQIQTHARINMLHYTPLCYNSRV